MTDTEREAMYQMALRQLAARRAEAAAVAAVPLVKPVLESAVRTGA